MGGSGSLARRSAKFRHGVLAGSQTIHCAIRINRGSAARLRRALYLSLIVGGAIAHTALDDTISIPDRATARLGTEHHTVLIRSALPLSAHHVSMLVLDAIPGIDLGADHRRHNQQATNCETILHVFSFHFELQKPDVPEIAEFARRELLEQEATRT
jgi:hypothetical protein